MNENNKNIFITSLRSLNEVKVFDLESTYLVWVDFSNLKINQAELENMLLREKRMDVFKKCLDFLDTRVELDQRGFKEDIFENLNPMNVVKSRNSLGGTGFDQVKIELKNWKNKLFI